MLSGYDMTASPSRHDPLPLSGPEVLVLSIGRNVSLADVQGAAAGPNEGLTTAGEPFGGSLEPQVLFGAGLIPIGITHYRWSYRRLGSAEAWQALDQPVIRHYAEVLNDGTLLIKPFLLGPAPLYRDQTLFQIPPARPPQSLGAAASFWTPEINPRLNAASAFFRTDWLDAGGPAFGKYELKLELFRADGRRASLNDVRLTMPTTPQRFGPARQAPRDPAHADDPREEYVFRDGAGAVVAFRLVLHVDNRPCEAAIQPPVLHTAARGCTRLSFRAYHPAHFATAEFETHQGDQGGVPSASVRGLADGTLANGFVREPSGWCWKDVPLVELVSQSGRVAFHCTLLVKARATDGWRRLAHLDRWALPRLFMLDADQAAAKRSLREHLAPISLL